MAVPPPPTYRRLPGRKKGFLMGQHTLWQARDHLLQIYARWGSEDYKRYYFSDIQATVTRKTEVGKIQNFVLGALVGLFGLFAATSESVWMPFNTIIAVVILCILIINVLKGPTCETHLLTAVQTEKLHSLNRLNTAQAVMNQLKPIIEHYQGAVSPDTLLQQGSRVTDSKKNSAPTRLASRAPAVRKNESGRAHMMLFVLLSFNGLLVTAGFVLNHAGLTLLGTIVVLAMGICVVVALVKQHESNLKHSVRTMTWAALGYVCFSFVSSYIISVGLAFKNPDVIQNQWEMIKLFSKTTPWDSALMMTLNVIALGGAVAIGIPGICLLRKYQKARGPAKSQATGPASIALLKRIP